MTQKRGLGRGLGALIPGAGATPAPEQELRTRTRAGSSAGGESASSRPVDMFFSGEKVSREEERAQHERADARDLAVGMARAAAERRGRSSTSASRRSAASRTAASSAESVSAGESAASEATDSAGSSTPSRSTRTAASSSAAKKAGTTTSGAKSTGTKSTGTKNSGAKSSATTPIGTRSSGSEAAPTTTAAESGGAAKSPARKSTASKTAASKSTTKKSTTSKGAAEKAPAKSSPAVEPVDAEAVPAPTAPSEVVPAPEVEESAAPAPAPAEVPGDAAAATASVERDTAEGDGETSAAAESTDPGAEIEDSPVVDVEATTPTPARAAAEDEAPQETEFEALSETSTEAQSEREDSVPATEHSEHQGLMSVPGAEFAEIPIHEVRENPRNPRTAFDEDELDELAYSLREVGVLQPVVVRPISVTEDGESFELVMGERRWRAARRAGLLSIPAIIRETSDDDLLRDALLENLHRTQLNPLEEANAYQQLLDDFGCTQDELGERIGRSRPQITNTLRLLRLPALVQRRLASGAISAGHARALLSLDDPSLMEELAQRIVQEGLSVRAVERLVARGGQQPSTRTVRRSTYDPHVVDLTSRLSNRLEAPVRIDVGKRKGRVTLEFTNLEDLERLIENMGLEVPLSSAEHSRDD